MVESEREKITVDQIRAGVERGELRFYYQPIISMISGRITGAEALMRWVEDDGNIIPPGYFIPIAEQSGYIDELTIALLPSFLKDVEQMIRCNAEWTVNLNAPGICFHNDQLTDQLLAATNDRFQPHQIAIEITETSKLEESQSVQRNLKRIREAGIDLYMDDFSTGYSSLDLLSRVDFKAIKIDQGMVQRMLNSEKNTTMVYSMIRMAIKMDMQIIAEGIETEELYTFLLQIGCTRGQGFWLGRPMPLESICQFRDQFKPLGHFPAGFIHHAQINHLEWRSAIIREISSLEKQGKSFPVKGANLQLDHNNCLLGRWYNGEGQRYAGHPAFEGLHQPHENFHRAGAEILKASRKGCTKKEMGALLQKLTECSSTVIRLLEELEDEAITDQESPPS